MQISGARIHVVGRMKGLTIRSTADLVAAHRGKLVRRAAKADLTVVAHQTALAWPDLSREPLVSEIVSEMQFRRAVGLLPPVGGTDHTFTAADVARLAGLPPDIVESLAIYDVLDAVEGRFSFLDLAVARQARRLLDEGVALNLVLQTGAALRVRGLRLNSTTLRETPWGTLATAVGEDLATAEGQLELPLAEPRVRFDEIFDTAEECEVEGDLAGAERLYRLAARIDSSEPFCMFNLGNVLARCGRDDEAVWAFLQAAGRDAVVSADCHYNIAILNSRGGETAKAEQAYRQALEHNPSHDDARHNLALLLSEQSRYAEALPLWAALAREGSVLARRQSSLCRMAMMTAPH